MTPSIKRSLAGLLAVAALLCASQPARAGVFVCEAAVGICELPGVEVFLNGESLGKHFARPGESGFSLDFDLGSVENGFVINGSLDANPDPFIGYGLAVTNFTGAPLGFLFAFFSPYVGGPYNTLTSSHSSSVTDSGAVPDGSVTVAPTDASGFVHVPHVDASTVPAANLGLGCAVVLGAGGSGVCDAGGLVSVGIGPTPAAGFFDVFVGFTLSPGDIYTGNGRVELTSVAVPEPVVIALLGLGLGAVAVLRRRRT